MERGRRRRRLRAGLSAAGRAQDPHRPRRAAGRRLPDAQHLGVIGYRRRRPQAGDGVDSRRRLRPRFGEPAALRRARAGRRRRRRRRHRELPPRRLRIPGSVVIQHPRAPVRQQLGAARRAARPALDPRQHRRLRWRPRPRHAVRRVGRRRHRHHLVDQPGSRRTVRRRNRTELAGHLGLRRRPGPSAGRAVPHQAWSGAQRNRQVAGCAGRRAHRRVAGVVQRCAAAEPGHAGLRADRRRRSGARLPGQAGARGPLASRPADHRHEQTRGRVVPVHEVAADAHHT